MKIKIFILSTLAFYSMLRIQAQESDDSYNIFDQYANWGIQLDPLAYFPATVTRTQGDITLTPKYSFGYKLGLVYNLNFTNHFSLKVGALVGKAPAIDTYFRLKNTDIDMSEDYRYSHIFPKFSPFYFSFPALLEYRNFLSTKYILHIDAGVQVDRITTANIQEKIPEYGYHTAVSSQASWEVDPIIKLGVYYRFYFLMLQSDLVYKHKLHNQYEGEYAFDKLKHHPVDTQGSYIQKGDYIGLSFTIYPRWRKPLVNNECPGNVHSKQVMRKQRAIEKEKRRKQRAIEKARRKKQKQLEKIMKKRKKNKRYPKK